MISGYSAFVGKANLDPFWTLIPSLFAKSSFLWFPLLYIISNKQIRYKISKRIYNFSKYSTNNTTTRPNLNLLNGLNTNNNNKNQSSHQIIKKNDDISLKYLAQQTQQT